MPEPQHTHFHHAHVPHTHDTPDADDIRLHFPPKNNNQKKTEHVVDSYKPPKNLTNKNDSFIGVITAGLSEFRFKPYIFLFFIFIIITCDIFIDKGLSTFSGAVSGNDVTNYGVFLQGLLIVILFIIVDHACQYEYI